MRYNGSRIALSFLELGGPFLWGVGYIHMFTENDV